MYTTETLRTIADEMLPILNGSEKQVAWGTEIRARLVDAIIAQAEKNAPNGCSDEQIAEMRTFFARFGRLHHAGWWIDHRNEPAGVILSRIVKG